MSVVQLGKNKVEVFDSIDTLPVARFHKYNKFMLIDSGVGSDVAALNVHINRILGFMVKDPQNARTELENMRQNLYLISQEMSPKYMAFAALIKSINGREVFDISDANLLKLLSELREAPVGPFDKAVEVLKKKFQRS